MGKKLVPSWEKMQSLNKMSKQSSTRNYSHQFEGEMDELMLFFFEGLLESINLNDGVDDRI